MQLTNQTVPMLAFGDEKQGIHLLLHKSLQFGQSQKRRRNNLYRIHLCEIHGVAEVMNVLHSGKKPQSEEIMQPKFCWEMVCNQRTFLYKAEIVSQCRRWRLRRAALRRVYGIHPKRKRAINIQNLFKKLHIFHLEKTHGTQNHASAY